MAGACGLSLICANRLTDAQDTDLDRPPGKILMA
jgi:hypothetical protein